MLLKADFPPNNICLLNQLNLESKFGNVPRTYRNCYCHEFQIYTGKVDVVTTEEGLGYRVVKDLTRKITGKGHLVYMENFFSSPNLYCELYE